MYLHVLGDLEWFKVHLTPSGLLVRYIYREILYDNIFKKDLFWLFCDKNLKLLFKRIAIYIYLKLAFHYFGDESYHPHP